MADITTPDLPHSRHWRFSLDIEAIGWLILDRAETSTNTLSQEVLSELEQLMDPIESLAASEQMRGLVMLSDKDNGFAAGADISEFDDIAEPEVLRAALERTHRLFARLEQLSVPTAAGIHGFCLGGGLELALACHYRIAVDDDATRIGFPEVKLGIFPGFGGTGRSIRQAGPVDAMQMMLSGRNLRATQAKRIGIVDKLVRHRDTLRWAGRKAVLEKRRAKAAGLTERAAAMGPVRGYTARKMREETEKKVRPEHYPAPFALIDLFEKYGDDPLAMIGHESDAFIPLMNSDTAANLRRIFFLTEDLKKQRQRGSSFKRVHVVGAGVMGGDIAAWCALRGMAVTLQDLNMERIKPALDRARKLFQKRLKKRHLVDTAMLRLEPDPSGRGVARADVIIEAVLEDLEIKRNVFADVEEQAKPDAILATNTSSIELERIAEGLKDPGRLIGLHFFNPVAQLPLVEVVRSEHNSDEAVARGASFALAIAKSPVVVRSKPGFLVNRVLMPYMLGAVERVEKGESKELLDAAAVAFGMPMGPIELMDMVGLDVGKSVAQELGHDVPEGSQFNELVSAGKLGRKSGEGFYRWEDGKAVKGEVPEHADLQGLGRELVVPLVDATEAAVADGVVESPEKADIGVVLGTGFAPFRGGPLKARADGKV
ncbi:fatty-acid oxidation protein subunit alpha [Devosia pacifica]|uniref:enoyl-CoA hydratase n=1 Tax=Devosia pacifica TaxID=1335967 RepID=A0A918SG77_9HYPH|nr:3-hydroxyacyl-CoA dehydrogenase NAD-binding domain-containing protein [Devosia pacifica]GHA37626.1 fatty-acid oxidation protein subunit alpha [Devosia pacifica]